VPDIFIPISVRTRVSVYVDRLVQFNVSIIVARTRVSMYVGRLVKYDVSLDLIIQRQELLCTWSQGSIFASCKEWMKEAEMLVYH
jgi:hypothetical protein